MNIHVCGGRSSSDGLKNLGFNKLFLIALCFSLLSEVYSFTVEWSLVSPYQLSQSRNNWQTLQGGNTADIDFSKGGQIAFVPASPGYGYGLYNRGSPPVINLNLGKPKHKDGSSSEEHKHKRKHGDSSEEHSKHKPEHHEHHPEHHPEHHKSAKEELNEEHAEQAEVSARIADGLTKLSHFMKEQMNTHVELRDRELNRGNEEAAKKEQAIIDLYQEQIKLINGVEKVQEAIMKGEVGMVYDNDGAGHGHHGHNGDGHHEGHGDHHHGDHENHHDADQPRHHHNDEDDDEEHGGYDDDDEGRDEGEYGHDDDDDEGHGGYHGHDDDDDEEPDHQGGHGHDHEGGGHDHEGGGHGHEGEEHGHGHEGGEHGHGHEGGEHGHGHEGGEHGHGHEGGEHGHDHEGQGHQHGGNQEDDEFHDATDKFDDDPDYDPNSKHKLDRRSPFVSSFLPSLSGTDTSLKTPDTVAVDTTVNADAAANAKIQTDTGVTIAPSDTPAATPYATTDGSTPPSATTAVSTDAPAAPTPLVVSPDENTNSGWFSWFKSSNTPVYSPYALLKYLSPSDKSADNLMSMFNVFSDPSNNSYLSNASTLMRIVMFFMPGTGIVDQVYFTMALSKIMWEAATMYYEGYGTVEIAVVVLGEMAEASYLSRRGEDSIISQKILTPGDTVKIDGMDVPAFLKYVKYMKYPDLTEAQEAKLQKDIDNLINITYPNISPQLKTTFTAGLKDTMRFLSLFNVSGDLHVENVDVNFSEVYIKMHSAFDDSPLEKIKKTILSAIDAVKSKFN